MLPTLVKAKALYLSGKLCFFENAYANSLRNYRKAIDLLTEQLDGSSEIGWEDKVKAKTRIAKCYQNMGLTKSMSSNHKQAQEICDKSLPIIETLIEEEESLPEETASATQRNRHSKILYNYWLKKAILLKRSSSFRESKETLENLKARINAHQATLSEGT